jgi:two-component system sensor histidine kinase NblS
MGNLEKNNENNISGLFNLSTQNKLIILGWLLSSVLIFVTAWFVIGNTQKKIFESYYNFGLMISKTLSVDSVDLISDIPEEEIANKLEKHARSIIKGNQDISYIVFRDADGDILYSNKNTATDSENIKLSKKIEISTPMVSDINGNKKVIGNVQLGLTGKTMDMVGKTTRDSMIIIFTVAWIVSIFAVLINTLLITRQVTLLLDGVKRISTGEFGYTLASKDLWGEIKQLFEAFNDMSARLRKYEEKNIDQLTYERNKLEAVLMSIANGVVVCDNYDQVILANNAALKMLDMSTREIINSKIQNYCDSNGKLCLHNVIEKFKDTPLEEIEAKPLESQLEVDNKIIQAIISPIFTLNQDYLGYIIVMHDITKEAEIDKMKSCFISNVSHELRTPVTVLRSYIDTLYNFGNDFDEKTRKEFLETINNEADRLNKMVNDVLDFSRLESPNVKLDKIPADIAPIIELTVESMRVIAEEKNVSFSIIIEPNLPKVFLNTESIERAMKNLLSNAIKYSRNSGKIKIRAEIDRSGKYLEVSVEDNGTGIPQEHLAKIFDRFYRVENNTHTIKGTGLGLHLVKVSIEKHHAGEVFVNSKLNEGSTFGFRLPVNPPENTEEDEWEISLEKNGTDKYP